jgi:hypothetical protein
VAGNAAGAKVRRICSGFVAAMFPISRLSKCQMGAYAAFIQRVIDREKVDETGCMEAAVF